jgi:hypothetical protein
LLDEIFVAINGLRRNGTRMKADLSRFSRIDLGIGYKSKLLDFLKISKMKLKLNEILELDSGNP